MERFVCMSIDDYLASDESSQISDAEYLALTVCVDGFIYVDNKNCMMRNNCTAHELKESYEHGDSIVAVHVNVIKLESMLRPLNSSFEANGLINYAFGDLRFDQTLKKITSMGI